jgi:hypothetical protein
MPITFLTLWYGFWAELDSVVVWFLFGKSAIFGKKGKIGSCLGVPQPRTNPEQSPNKAAG